MLGAGVMGSQIAAHCVNAGLHVHLLDRKSEDPKQPNRLAEESIRKLTQMTPAPFANSADASRINPGNFEDDLDVISQADWVCEVIVERLDIKQDLMKRVEEHWKEGTVVSSNTSGLPISQLAEPCGEAFQRHVIGTHFFNPPRYMTLLEVIPTAKSDPVVVERMALFCEVVLGKGVVVCKDTPNFIANRIGVFSMAAMLPYLFDGSFRVEEIDYLTGTLTGYSKAAAFRTADLAGLDVLAHVASNLVPAIPNDERREVFRLPEAFMALVKRGSIGNKGGSGFYKKVKTEAGREFWSLQADTLEYTAQEPVQFDSADEAKAQCSGAGERLRYLVAQEDRAGRFLWETQRDLLLYAANRVPEISDSVEAVDRAMRWGFNWELGPFERWDAIGVRGSAERMEQEGFEVPAWVKAMLDAGVESFYDGGDVVDPRMFAGGGGVAERGSGVLGTSFRVPCPPPAKGAILVSDLDREGREVMGNDSAGLYDMGDGVALFAFRTKNQTLGFELVQTLESACDLVEKQFDALVIGHDREHFSYGANLAEAGVALRAGDKKRIREAVEGFQRVAVGLRYRPFPVVASVAGRAFGGGVEFFLHCDRVVAHHELYCGLIELGVGLIPAGGGTKELLLRSLHRVAWEEQADPLPYLKSAFKTIGLGKVSMSAWEARQLGYLREKDVIMMNRFHLLRQAKTEARALADQGYRPPLEPSIRLLGATGYSALDVMLYIMEEGGFVAPYDRVLAQKVAKVMTGGALSEGQDVPESVVLQLEREAILECMWDERTHKKMAKVLGRG